MNLKKILDSVTLTSAQKEFLENYKKGNTEYFPKSDEFGEFSGRYVSEEVSYNSRKLKKEFPALFTELKRLIGGPSKEEKDSLRSIAESRPEFLSFKIRTNPQGSAYIDTVLQNSQPNYPKITGWFIKEADGTFTGYDPQTSNSVEEPTLAKAIASYKRLIKNTHEGKFNWK